MGKSEREKNRVANISTYAEMLAASLATVMHDRKTGELVFQIKFSDGGFYGHTLRLVEEIKYSPPEE